jgi:hypothetical protein
MKTAILYRRFIGLPVWVLLVCSLGYANLFSAPVDKPSSKPAFEMRMQGFIENKGQVLDFEGNACTEALYVFQASGMRVFITQEGLAYQFQQEQTSDHSKDTAWMQVHRMDMKLNGMRKPTSIRSEGKSRDYLNDLRAGVLDIHSYQKITMASVYPNIDWVIYTESGKVKYDFVVHPGGNPEDIQLKFTGHDAVALNADGGLRASCGMGEVNESAPVSFQNHKQVSTAFVLKDDIIGFKPSHYDPTQTLTIDPEVVWCTYYGGTGGDWFNVTIAVSPDGHIYHSANTTSDNIAVNGYSLQRKSQYCPYVVKFDSAGNRIWSTYIGSRSGVLDPNSTIESQSIALDASGNIYIGGTHSIGPVLSNYSSFSMSGLTTQGAHKVSATDQVEGLLIKLNAQGQMLWGTLYGGNLQDRISGVTCDAMQNVYICGTTQSPTGIAQNGHIITHSGGQTVGFLAKMDSAGNRVWGTYYYGSNVYGSSVLPKAIALDSAGFIVMVGHATDNGLATTGAYQSLRAGLEDGFMSMWNPQGALTYATYLGGSAQDYVSSVVIDRSQNIYVGGLTYSKSGIALNGHQMIAGSSNSGISDVFLTKFNRSTGMPFWSTYIGGSDSENLSAGNTEYMSLAVSDSGICYAAFTTRSTNNIEFRGFKSNPNFYDIGIMAFSPEGSRIWGSYFGGNGAEHYPAITIDNHDKLYVSGLTNSTGIANRGITQFMGGGYDCFIAQIQDCHMSNSCLEAEAPILTSNVVNDTVCPGSTIQLSVINSQLHNAAYWQWYTGGCGVVPIDTGLQTTQFIGASRTFYVRGEGGSIAPGPCDSIRIGTYPNITNNLLSSNQQLCAPGIPLTITGTIPQGGNGVYTYIWRSATDIESFSIIPGATDRDYIPGVLTQTSYFRRQAISQCPNAVFSLNHMVEIQPFVNSIGSPQVILFGTAPALLTGTSQRPNPWYQWEQSNDMHTWQAIQSSTDADYQPGILIRTTYYRRNVGGIHSCDHIAGNTIMIEVVELISQLVQVQSNSPVCQGSPVYLQTTAPTGATFSWTGPSNFQSALQNPSLSNVQPHQSGIYRLRVTLPNGDTIIHTHLVQIGTRLNTLTATYIQPLCHGTKLDLSATAMPFVTYSWQGPGGFTATGVNAIRPFDYNQSLQGQYTLTANSPGCGSTTRTVTVQVNSNQPISRQAPATICTGTQFILHADFVAQAGYTWLGPNGFSTTQRSIVRNGTAFTAGTYTLIQTVPGCAPATNIHQITVAPAANQIVSSTNSPVCQQNTLHITANTLPGVQYLWSGPNGFREEQPQAARAAIEAATGAGIYTLSITYPGCFTQTRTHTVVVNNPASAGMIISPAQACAGATVTLNTTALPNTTYLWTGPDGFASALSNPVRNNANIQMSGVYSLTLTQAGCAPLEMQQSLNVYPSGAMGATQYPSLICAPDTITLLGSHIPNTSMSWSGPNGFNAFGNSVTIPVTSIAQQGIYRYTVSANQCVAYQNFYLGVRDTSAIVATVNSDTFCVGQAAYFSATPISGASFTWTGPASFQSTLTNPSRSNLQPIHTGIYSLQVNVPGCGLMNKTLSLDVLPSISSVVATNPTPIICAPTSLSMTGTVIPGANMHWTGPNGFTASGSHFTIPVTQAQQSGVYQYHVSTAKCGSVTRNASVIINTATPISAIANKDTFCTNEVAYFSALSTSTATHIWNGPGGFLASGGTVSRSNIQPAHAGEYTLSIQVLGCGTLSSTVSIHVHTPITSISLPTSAGACAPAPLTFSGTSIPNVVSWWQGPNGFTSAGANVNIPVSHPNQSGVWSYHISASGCWSTFRTLPVVVNSPAMAEGSISSPVCVSNPIYMQATFVPGATYQWQGPDGFVANTQNASRDKATLPMGGMYTLNVSIPNCGVQARQIQLIVNPCRKGSDALSDNDDASVDDATVLTALKVYPNPASHSLQFDAGNSQIEYITLQDLQGKTIVEYAVHTHSGSITLPENMSAGVYLAIFKTTNGKAYRKFQKSE